MDPRSQRGSADRTGASGRKSQVPFFLGGIIMSLKFNTSVKYLKRLEVCNIYMMLMLMLMMMMMMMMMTMMMMMMSSHVVKSQVLLQES